MESARWKGKRALYCSTLFSRFQKRSRQVHFVVCAQKSVIQFEMALSRVWNQPQISHWCQTTWTMKSLPNRRTCVALHAAHLASLSIHLNYRHTRMGWNRVLGSFPARYFPCIRSSMCERGNESDRKLKWICNDTVYLAVKRLSKKFLSSARNCASIQCIRYRPFPCSGSYLFSKGNIWYFQIETEKFRVGKWLLSTFLLYYRK